MMAVTAKEAVAGLAAAANNIEGLTLAIEKASFLDATPGDDRQKLRGTTPHCWSLTIFEFTRQLKHFLRRLLRRVP